jgi:uncharacterized protein YjbJ (UPF0337 family)
MSAKDKSRNKVQEVAGQIEEKAGQITGDDDLEAHGKAEQTKGNLKQAGEKVKDAFNHGT